MSIFVHATPASDAKTPAASRVGVALAGVLVIFATAQLFGFEKFPKIIEEMVLPGVDEGRAVILAALLVACEVFAVPFLLRMRLSVAMRVFSMVAGWLVGSWWLLVVMYQNFVVSITDTVGLLGATVAIPPGIWSLFLILGLDVLVVWASWGLWPLGRTEK